MSFHTPLLRSINITAAHWKMSLLCSIHVVQGQDFLAGFLYAQHCCPLSLQVHTIECIQRLFASFVEFDPDLIGQDLYSCSYCQLSIVRADKLPAVTIAGVGSACGEGWWWTRQLVGPHLWGC